MSIMIIVLLAALLFPAMQSASKKALEMQCVSRMRGVGAALSNFVADNEGKIPTRTVQQPSVAVTPPEPLRYWTSRLIRGGYLDNRDSLYCPAWFPYRDALATKTLEDDGGQTFGLRVWVPAGMDWNMRWKDQPLASIESPSNFFLLADSVWLTWTHNGKPTQGYGFNPSDGSAQNQKIHLRHFKRANTLFADFHIESKPATYFLDEVPATQAAYSNNNKYYVQEDDSK